MPPISSNLYEHFSMQDRLVNISTPAASLVCFALRHTCSGDFCVFYCVHGYDAKADQSLKSVCDQHQQTVHVRVPCTYVFGIQTDTVCCDEYSASAPKSYDTTMAFNNFTHVRLCSIIH